MYRSFNDPKWMCTTEVAELLRISQPTVMRRVQAGELPCRRVGKRWIFDRVALEKIAGRRSKPREVIVRPTGSEALHAGLSPTPPPKVDSPTIKPLSEIEKECVLRAISITGGDRATAAQSLGISITVLTRKLNEYGVTGTDLKWPHRFPEAVARAASYKAPENSVMTIDEVAEYLRISRSTVLRHFKAGGLPGIRFGSIVRFARATIESLITRGRESEDSRFMDSR